MSWDEWLTVYPEDVPPADLAQVIEVMMKTLNLRLEVYQDMNFKEYRVVRNETLNEEQGK